MMISFISYELYIWYDISALPDTEPDHACHAMLRRTQINHKLRISNFTYRKVMEYYT